MTKLGLIGLAGITNDKKKYMAMKFSRDKNDKYIAVCMKYPSSAFTDSAGCKEIVTLFNVADVMVDQVLNEALFPGYGLMDNSKMPEWRSALIYALNEYDLYFKGNFRLAETGHSIATELFIDTVYTKQSTRSY